MSIPTVILGNSGIEVTEICFGTLTLSPIQAGLPPEEAGALIRRALEQGITFIDTAQGYKCYPHVKAGIDGWDRKKVVIATKTHAKTAEEMQAAFDEACREMGIEYIDIFHLHLISSPEDFRNRSEALVRLLELKEAGCVKAIGISVHSIEPLRYIINNNDIDICYPIFNIHSLGINDGTVDEMADVLEELHDKGKGIYAMKPLGGGHLRKEFDKALDFVRRFSCIDAVSIGMKHKNELELNLAYFKGEKITEEMRQSVDTVERKLIINRLCKKCGMCIAHCEQGALHMGKDSVYVDEKKCIFCGYCAPLCPQFAIRVI